MNSILDEKKKKELVNKFDNSRFTDNTGLDKSVETLTTKTNLNAEWDEIEKLLRYKFSLFIGQSYFITDGLLSYLFIY